MYANLPEGSEPEATGPALGRGRIALLMLALMLAEITAGFETGLMYGAVQPIYQFFAGSSLIGWVFSAYLLVAAPCGAIFARLGDLHGRRLLLNIALVISIIGSLIAGFATDPAGIIVGRALQGTSGAILPLCYGIARESMPRKMALAMIGILSATVIVASGIGILLGGLIADHVPWQALFFLSAVVGVLAVISVSLWVPRHRAGPAGDLDWIGGLLFVPGLILLLLGIDRIRHWDEQFREVVGLTLGGLAVLVAWVWHESRHAQPLIDVRALADRRVALANACMFLVGMGAVQANVVVPLLMQQAPETGAGLGLSATVAGGLMMATLMTPLISGPWAGWLAVRHGGRMPLLIGTIALALSWIAITVSFHSLWVLVPLLFIQAFGVAMVMAGTPMVLVETVSVSRTSEVTAMASVLRQLGMALGSQGVGLVLVIFTSADGDKRVIAPAAFYSMFAAVAVLSCLACGLAMMLSRRPLADRAPAGTAPAGAPGTTSHV